MYTINLEHGQGIPDEIISALIDNSVTKWAFDAHFVRVCLCLLRMLGDFSTPAAVNPLLSLRWSLTVSSTLAIYLNVSLDQNINDRGVLVDMDFMHNAIVILIPRLR